MKERLAIARSALATLDELLRSSAPTKVDRDAAIQRFEYTVEAIWKAAQRYLEVVEGLTLGSPKGCIRASREVGLLDEAQTTSGLEMIDDRNATMHAHNGKLAEKIHAALPGYAGVLRAWLEAMESRVGSDPI